MVLAWGRSPNSLYSNTRKMKISLNFFSKYALMLFSQIKQKSDEKRNRPLGKMLFEGLKNQGWKPERDPNDELREG